MKIIFWMNRPNDRLKLNEDQLEVSVNYEKSTVEEIESFEYDYILDGGYNWLDYLGESKAFMDYADQQVRDYIKDELSGN